VVIKEAKLGSIVLAEEQTAGRGRFSPTLDNL